MSNKGYYSWIHTLKSAAMDSRNKGIEMINEQKARKITDPTKQAEMAKKLSVPTPAPEAVNPEDGMPEEPTADPRDIKAALSGLGKTTPSTIALADGDVGAYVNLRRMKQAEKLAQMASKTGPVNAKPAGDAQAVEDDAQDGVVADPEISRLPSYPIAAQAREETADIEREAAYMAKQEEEEEDMDLYPTANWRTVKESVSDKINRFFGA
jgi:hypothetical protein